ncbi:MAG: serine/threonine-protein kinase [Acidobacteriota bacterium]
MPARETCPDCGSPIPVPAAGCPRCGETLLDVSSGSGAGDGHTLVSLGGAEEPGRVGFGGGVGAEVSERYEILEVLGQGAMGRVVKARDRRLERLVAIKRVLKEMAVHPRILERFIREAHALARFSHPGIVGVLDVGDDSDGVYIVMEHVEGPSLQALLGDDERFEPTRACDVVCKLLAALVVLHERTVIHRDLKPHNIIMKTTREGVQPVLIDFGLARGAEDGELTAAGDAMGTPHYMAPEQWSSATGVDHRADLYAVGAILYRLLTGKLPLEIDESALPDELRAVTLHLLQRDRKERPETAAAALEELTEAQEALSAPAETTSAATAHAEAVASSQVRTRTTEETSAEPCSACGRGLPAEHQTCRTCGSQDRFCSEACFERHVEEAHCISCQRPLGGQHVMSEELNRVLGQELRFCSSSCRRTHQRRHVCARCESALPRAFLRSARAETLAGRELRFCSDDCVSGYVNETACHQCGQALGASYLSSAGRGAELRFCSDACFQRHAQEHR